MDLEFKRNYAAIMQTGLKSFKIGWICTVYTDPNSADRPKVHFLPYEDSEQIEKAVDYFANYHWDDGDGVAEFLLKSKGKIFYKLYKPKKAKENEEVNDQNLYVEFFITHEEDIAEYVLKWADFEGF